MTKMATMPPCLYMVKTLQKSSPEPADLFYGKVKFVNLGFSIGKIIVYINDDPGLTLTYFTARSKIVT